MKPIRQLTWQAFGLVLISVLAIFSIFKTNRKAKELERFHRYTIGTTIGAGKNFRSSTSRLEYEYKVFGKTYISGIDLESLSGIEALAGKYIVKFSPLDPTNSALLIGMPVAPDSGYTTIPTFLLKNN